METTGNGNGHTAIWARLASVEGEYKKLQAERDAALLERDQARAMLIPLLEQVEKLHDMILAQLPKQDKRLPSVRAAYSVTPEMVDRWIEQYESGISLTRIAQSSKSRVDTIMRHLQERGIEVQGKRPYGHGRKSKCPKCGEKLEDGEEGVCASCLSVDRIVEEHRMAKEAQ